MAPDLSGQVAIVSGSTRGIGRGVAEHLVGLGMSVVVHGRSEEIAVKVAAEIGGQAIGVGGDIGDPETSTRMVSRALDAFGRLDLVVNNAGVALDNRLLNVTDDRWEATLRTNLSGPFYLTRAAVPALQDRGGAIVNVTSYAGEKGNSGQAAYSASKGGLASFTCTCAKELGRHGIRVNAVAPAVLTGMSEAVPEEIWARIRAVRPIKRDGTVEDIARVIAFLASSDASFITGQLIHVDGGMHIV